MSARRNSRFVVPAVVLGFVLSTLAARRHGYSGLGGNTVVRCSQGHLFTTIWIPGASFKAVRLGTRRFQRCPVGRHWALVRPVKDADLAEWERRSAAEHRDVRIP
jgi:hypothetical protein